jgi:hypothetical protein
MAYFSAFSTTGDCKLTEKYYRTTVNLCGRVNDTAEGNSLSPMPVKKKKSLQCGVGAYLAMEALSKYVHS